MNIIDRIQVIYPKYKGLKLYREFYLLSQKEICDPDTISKSINWYYYNLNIDIDYTFKNEMDFSEYSCLTFENGYNEEHNIQYWKLPYMNTYSFKTISEKSYVISQIVNNSYIWLSLINKITPEKNDFFDYLALAILWNINNKLKTDLKLPLNTFLNICILNYLTRLNDGSLKPDIQKTNLNNLKSYYKIKGNRTFRFTVGNASKSEKHSASMKKFTVEEENYVKKCKEQKVQYRLIQKQFKNKFNKEISLKKISNIK